MVTTVPEGHFPHNSDPLQILAGRERRESNRSAVSGELLPGKSRLPASDLQAVNTINGLKFSLRSFVNEAGDWMRVLDAPSRTDPEFPDLIRFLEIPNFRRPQELQNRGAVGILKARDNWPGAKPRKASHSSALGVPGLMLPI